MSLKRFEERNRAIRQDFGKQIQQHPEYKISAILRKVAAKWYLAPSTVEKIVQQRGQYA